MWLGQGRQRTAQQRRTTRPPCSSRCSLTGLARLARFPQPRSGTGQARDHARWDHQHCRSSPAAGATWGSNILQTTHPCTGPPHPSLRCWPTGVHWRQQRSAAATSPHLVAVQTAAAVVAMTAAAALAAAVMAAAAAAAVSRLRVSRPRLCRSRWPSPMCPHRGEGAHGWS